MNNIKINLKYNLIILGVCPSIACFISLLISLFSCLFKHLVLVLDSYMLEYIYSVGA